MKYSQVQDVEYLLKKYLSLDMKLVVKFNDDTVIGNFIKDNQTEDNMKYRFDDIKYRFDDYIDNLYFSSGKKPDWFVSKDEYLYLNELMKFTNKVNQRTTEFAIYNLKFLNSDTKLRLLLVNPETDFEIIGLAD